MTYFCEQVLPILSSLTSPAEGIDVQLEVSVYTLVEVGLILLFEQLLMFQNGAEDQMAPFQTPVPFRPYYIPYFIPGDVLTRLLCFSVQYRKIIGCK